MGGGVVGRLIGGGFGGYCGLLTVIEGKYGVQNVNITVVVNELM